MTDRAREKALKVGVAHAAWHSGPGVKVESVLAAIVETLGVTEEDVKLLRYLDGFEGITNGSGDVYVCTWVPEVEYARLPKIADALETLLEASR